MSIERWLLPLALFAAACDVGGAREAEEPLDQGSADDAAVAPDAPTSLDRLSSSIPNNAQFPNASGAVSTFSKQGSVDVDDAFFENFGTNGRDCSTCHSPLQGWSVSTADVQRRFDQSFGNEPIFRTVDGSNSPNANVSNLPARRNAYSMLRTRGVIRVGLPVPATAEFELAAVDDPYGFASAAQLSLFRRPLMSANLVGGPGSFVMWDGRETQPDFRTALSNQANGATLGHAQATASLPESLRTEIVDFETALFTAQAVDKVAGSLSAAGAKGGPEELAAQAIATGPFTLFDAWTNIPGNDSANIARRAIARGQALFNDPTKGLGGACAGCHNVANVGASTLPVFFNISLSSAARRTADLPLYTLRNKATGETVQSSDPGRALVTGLWADVSRFKVPSLRALASRAPYFHNGAAKTLEEVVKVYEESVGFNFTPAEEADLVAFLKAL